MWPTVQQVQSHKYLKIICVTKHTKFVATVMLQKKQQYISVRHIKYALDVTDRNVALSRTVKIQGSVHATTLHLKGLVYYGGYHFTCQIIDESRNIWFQDRKSVV